MRKEERRMRKWLRNVLSIVLVAAMALVVVSPLVQANVSQNTNTKSGNIPLTFTGVYTAHTNSTNLALTTDVNFNTVCGWKGWFQDGLLSMSQQLSVNGSPHVSALYYLENNALFFESAFSGVSSPTSVKIAKGTTISKSSYVFEVTEDFEIQNDGTGWKVVSQQPPQETKADVTISGFWGGSKTEVYLRTNLGSSHAFAENRFTTSDITVTRGTEEKNISSFYLFGAEGGSIHL